MPRVCKGFFHFQYYCISFNFLVLQIQTHVKLYKRLSMNFLFKMSTHYIDVFSLLCFTDIFRTVIYNSALFGACYICSASYGRRFWQGGALNPLLPYSPFPIVVLMCPASCRWSFEEGGDFAPPLRPLTHPFLFFRVSPAPYRSSFLRRRSISASLLIIIPSIGVLIHTPSSM